MLDGGLPVKADLIAFRDFNTPAAGWPWIQWMHEGWDGLHTVGQVLETWMTIYGVSREFLDGVTTLQLRGITGHIEWFPPTLAQRQHYRKVRRRVGLVAWWVGRSVGWLVGWSVGRLVGWLVGWSVGQI